MSNQLQITGGAKVRNLNGVITGTTGVLGSVPLGAANGVATLDSSGKVPVSQLPASVVTYLGTWNAATNTPTLVNGTGDPGDLYICNVAGTANFGAGPITFVVGDWVLYGSGIWQKSSGQNGTVTSVAVTETGDALTITGSPITTAGTINIGFAGTSAQYVAGNGSLITFPSLTGYVPYTGATSDVDLGTFKLNAQSLHVKGTAGSGHLGLKHQTSAATASASESSLFANVNGDLAWKNDNLYLSTFATYSNTADRVYTFPNASGTVALTSDLSAYVTLATTQTISGTKTFTATSTKFSKIRIDNSTDASPIAFKQYESGSIGEGGNTSLSAIGANQFNINWGGTKTAIFDSTNIVGDRTYTLPNADGTLALTSDIPSLSGYVTLATTQTISGAKTFTSLLSVNNKIYLKTDTGSTGVYLQSYSSNEFSIGATSGATTYYSSFILQYATRSYTFPNADGTIALTSQLTNGTVTSVGLSSATSGVTIGSSPITTSGTITLAIATASGSQQGLLSSTDWTTFNNKQNALTNPVTGTGTSNYLPKFTGTSTIGNSSIIDDASTVSAYTNAFRVFQIGGTGAAFYLSGNSTQATMSAITSAGAYQDLAISGATLTFFSGTLGSLGSSLAMTINPSGNVSIGNSNNTFKLDVTGTGRFTGALTGTSATFSSSVTVGTNFLLQGGTGFLQYNYSSDAASRSWRMSSDQIIFGDFAIQQTTTQTGGTFVSKFYINPSGNVGIGTSSASAAKLQLSGSNSLALAYFYNNSGSAGNVPGVVIEAGTNSSDYALNVASSLGTSRLYVRGDGNVGIGTTSPSAALNVSGINTSAAIDWTNTTASTGRTFRWVSLNSGGFAVEDITSGGERMRITSGGALCVATTSPEYTATNRGNITIGGVSSTILALQVNAVAKGYLYHEGTNMYLQNQVSGGNLYLQSGGSGGVALNSGATSWVSTSDERLKNINSSIDNAVEKLMTLRAVNFSWKSDESNKENLGLIAQDVEKVFPQVIDKNKLPNGVNEQSDDTEYLGVRYTELVPVLIKAIQELETRLKTLENK